MFRIVKIGDRDVPMLAMASVDVYYKRIFNEDPIKAQMRGDEAVVEFAYRMGFVMAMFAEKRDRKEMLKLNEDNYLDWLDGFYRADLMEALGEIVNVYESQKAPSSTEKKRADA